MSTTITTATATGTVLLAGLALLALATPPPAAAQSPGPLPIHPGIDIEAIKEAGGQAIDEAVARFIEDRRGGGIQTFAVLPLPQDIAGDYFTLRFQNEFSAAGRAAGYRLFTRDEPAFQRLLAEIEWGQNFGDTMDQATIQRFGAIEGVQGIIIPRLTVNTRGDTTTIRAILSGYEVETFAQLPGLEAKAEILPWWKQNIGILGLITGSLIILALFLALLQRIRHAMRPR